MATHTSILAWRIPWTEEPGRLQSMGLQGVRHNWATNTYLGNIFWSFSAFLLLSAAWASESRLEKTIALRSLPGSGQCCPARTPGHLSGLHPAGVSVDLPKASRPHLSPGLFGQAAGVALSFSGLSLALFSFVSLTFCSGQGFLYSPPPVLRNHQINSFTLRYD